VAVNKRKKGAQPRAVPASVAGPAPDVNGSYFVDLDHDVFNFARAEIAIAGNDNGTRCLVPAISDLRKFDDKFAVTVLPSRPHI
jgi:hypothetical protein